MVRHGERRWAEEVRRLYEFMLVHFPLLFHVFLHELLILQVQKTDVMLLEIYSKVTRTVVNVCRLKSASTSGKMRVNCGDLAK